MELLRPGDKRRQSLDRIRRDREQLLSEIDAAAAARLSVDETVQRFLVRLHDDVARAEQSMLAFSRPDVSPDLPAINAAFFQWLDPKAFEAQLRARLKPLLPASAPTLASRPAAIAKLKTRLAELDLQEERAICALESQGLLVDRRSDVDIETLLKVWDEADAVPDTR